MGCGIFQVAIGQSEWDKVSGDRIPVNYIYLRSDLKNITKYTLLQNKGPFICSVFKDPILVGSEKQIV